MAIQIAEAQRALNLAETWSQGFDDEIRMLLDQEVTYVRAEQLLETVWPTNEEDLHERTRTNRIYAHNGVMEARADEKWAPYRDTGWGFSLRSPSGGSGKRRVPGFPAPSVICAPSLGVRAGQIG